MNIIYIIQFLFFLILLMIIGMGVILWLRAYM